MHNKLIHVKNITPLHVGSGRGAGDIDSEIMREKGTGWPVVPGSSVKGVLRAAALDGGMAKDSRGFKGLFGMSGEEGSAGAVCCGDFRTLLFPVRSLHGGFAWTTCWTAIRRYNEIARACGADEIRIPRDASAVVHEDTVLGQNIWLEDIEVTATQVDLSSLANVVRDSLSVPDCAKQLCILDDTTFHYFCRHATEVSSRTAICYETGTARDKSLRTDEALPCECLLYGLLSFQSLKDFSAQNAESAFADLQLSYLQFGGNATTGMGFCRCTQI
jgi:CRISPR-associated protein Cmr4